MYCTNQQGSELYNATHGDPDLIKDMFEAAKERQSKKIKDPETTDDWHPPRRGYTREVEKLDDVVDNLIALRAEMGKWRRTSTRFTVRPLFPAQAVDELMRNRSVSNRDEKIKASQERHRQRRLAAQRDKPRP